MILPLVDKCKFCGAETELYFSGVPVCLKCSEDVQRRRTEKIPEKKPKPPPNEGIQN
jgi:hypothetical protein